MRPIELTLQGFIYFRNKAEIDLSKLDLFAITGLNGAGKSSLLDAMTFALYGQTERVGKEVNKLMLPGTTDLKVSFRFSAGGDEYRVTRTQRKLASRNDNKYKLERQQNGDWETLESKEKEVTTRVTKILGMDFKTFTQVIMLPQGEFDKFLKGEAADRRKILRKLAGFDIYDQMRAKAEEQANQFQRDCKSLQDQLDGLDVPAKAELDEKRSQYQSLEQEIPRLNDAFDRARQDLEAAEKLFERIKRLSVFQGELATLNEQATKIENLRLRLDRARVADRLQGSWDLVQEARKQYEKAQSAAKAASEKLSQAQGLLKIQQETLSRVQADQAEMEPKLKAREQALNSAQHIETQRLQVASEVSRAEQILAKKAELLAEKEEAVKTADAEFQAVRNRVLEADYATAQYSPGGARLEMLNQVAPLLTQWHFIEGQGMSDHTRLESAIQQLQTAEQDFQSAVLSLEQAEVAFREASTALQEAEAFNATVEQQNHAVALRLSLHPGDTCSVCGGVYPEAHLLSPLPKSSKVDIKPLQKRKAKAEETRQKVQTAKIQAEAKLENLKQNELQYRQNVKAREAELAGVQQQISALLPEDSWEVAALNREREVLQESDDNYRESLSHQKEAVAELQKSEQALQFAQQRRTDALSEHQEATENLEQQNLKLQKTEAKLYELTNGQSYDTLSQTLERDRQDLARRIDEANKSHQAAREKFIKAEEADTKAKKDVESASVENEQRNAEWSANLQAEGFTEESFLNSKASPEEQANWQKVIADHSQEKVRLLTLVQQETDEIGRRTTDEATIAQRREAIRAAEARLQQANDDRNNLSVKIQVAEQKQQEKDRLSTELSNKREQEKTYRTLATDLQSDKFQEYILEDFERDLVAQATVLLRELTAERYALKFENKEYWVEDYWSGGEARGVKNLSGGETFATCLSMALALSEMLARGAKLGSLFIDEGFGSLDAEKLEMVTNILESLSQQDRLVGIITHVPALAERLPTQIKVENSPEGGSQIIV